MAMSFQDWYASVDRLLYSRNRGVQARQLDQAALVAAYRAGVPPITFASQPRLPMQPPPPPIPPVAAPWDIARQRQAPQVLNDPRYLLNTGLCIGCPTCGSTNLANRGKATGTGLMYFGSIPFVLAASLIDSAIAQGLSGHRIECNYCGNSFDL